MWLGALSADNNEMEGRSPTDSPRAMALVLGALFAAGATVGALTLLLPHTDTFNDSELWTNIAVAFAGGIGCALLARRMPIWGLYLLLVVGTLIVTRAIYYSPDAGGFYSFWYVWVGVYAFFYFGRNWGAAYTALIGAAYAWALTQTDHTMAVARWVMTVTTIAVAGILIDTLGRRVHQRASEAASRARALAAVSSVAHELSRRTTSETAGPAICDAVVGVADAAGASLWEPTRDEAGLIATAATDPDLKGAVVRFLGDTSGAVKAFISGEPFFAAEAEGDEAVNRELVERLGVSSVLFQPIRRERMTIGVLVVYWRQPVPSLDSEVAMVVALLADEASLAIERAELFSQLERAARTDVLTGLHNRREWGARLERALIRARRNGTSLSVAMLDLDHFKDYNDRHGHQAGDRLLKEAAAQWQARLRESDVLARYGGEEFALALPDCELEEAEMLVERLRSSTPDEQKCSAGVVAWDGEESDVALVDRADRALYEAKRGGRDRVITG